MPIIPSTTQERYKFRCLEYSVRKKIERIVSAGGRVHIIWDVDGVLVSSRSDDVFNLLGFDVKKYFEYEERLIADLLSSGPWLHFAIEVGRPGRHISQDIVTARSSYLALRVTFLLLNYRLPTRWQLFVGHQSKKESYRIILESFKKDPDMHVFMVDDATKHVKSFEEISAELGMSSRCYGICSPILRDYYEADVKKEIELVFEPSNPSDAVKGLKNKLVFERVTENKEWHRHFVDVVDDPLTYLRNMFTNANREAYKVNRVSRDRNHLENLAKKVDPDKKWTDEELFWLAEWEHAMLIP